MERLGERACETPRRVRETRGEREREPERPWAGFFRIHVDDETEDQDHWGHIYLANDYLLRAACASHVGTNEERHRSVSPPNQAG